MQVIINTFTTKYLLPHLPSCHQRTISVVALAKAEMRMHHRRRQTDQKTMFLLLHIQHPRETLQHLSPAAVLLTLRESTKSVELGASYTLLAGELKNKQGLRICGNGEFQPQNRKTFRIYIGSWLLISNTIEQSPTGSFQFEIVFYKITTYQLKG